MIKASPIKHWTTTARTCMALLGLATLLTACIPSVNPFFTEKDLVSDDRLLGEWQEKGANGEPEIWKFEKGEGKAYKLLVTEKEGKQGEFIAHLFRLDQQFFLDLRPTDCHFATNQADLVAVAMVPGHLLVRVFQFGPQLKLTFFDPEWVEKYLKEHPAAVAHHVEDRGLILTADTEALQRFVLQHLGEGELFGKPGELVRKAKAGSSPVEPQTK